MPLARTRLGAGVLAGARAALPGGRAEDLLAWLRTPGDDRGGHAGAVDALEARVRRDEETDAREAARKWAPWALPRLDALAAAAEAGPEELLAALVAEAEAIWAAPHARRADVLDPEERDEARVAAELRSAAGELRALDPALLGDAAELLEALGAVEVRQGDDGDGVLLADPLDIRARRFRAVFVCGLQDGEFPTAARARAVPRRRGAARR